MIVVDDPIGCVVPSDDVLIIGTKAVSLLGVDPLWLAQNPGVPLEQMPRFKVEEADFLAPIRKSMRDHVQGPMNRAQRRVQRARTRHAKG